MESQRKSAFSTKCDKTKSGQDYGWIVGGEAAFLYSSLIN